MELVKKINKKMNKKEKEKEDKSVTYFVNLTAECHCLIYNKSSFSKKKKYQYNLSKIK